MRKNQELQSNVMASYQAQYSIVYLGGKRGGGILILSSMFYAYVLRREQ